jgi:prepilin-type N-terminal cleavage/methylation domain-containing protein
MTAKPVWPSRRIPNSQCRIKRRGFTLLEMLLAVGLVGLFLGAFQELVITGLRTANASEERADVRQQVVIALERFTREANMAGNIDVANATQFQFDADLDGNGTDETTNVNYWQNGGGDFERAQGGAAVTLIRDLGSIAYTYYDSAGANLGSSVSGAAMQTIRVVQIALTATRDQESLTVQSAVYLRGK